MYTFSWTHFIRHQHFDNTLIAIIILVAILMIIFSAVLMLMMMTPILITILIDSKAEAQSLIWGSKLAPHCDQQTAHTIHWCHTDQHHRDDEHEQDKDGPSFNPYTQDPRIKDPKPHWCHTDQNDDSDDEHEQDNDDYIMIITRWSQSQTLLDPFQMISYTKARVNPGLQDAILVNLTMILSIN